MNSFQVGILSILNFGAIFADSAPPPQGPYFIPIGQQQTPNCFTNSYVDPPQFCSLPPFFQPAKYASVLEANPLLAALTLSSALNLTPNKPNFNSIEHLPLNPYVALLLSHYGKYMPIYGKGRGLYGYVAANNYHNNKPFGSYKIFQDGDS